MRRNKTEEEAQERDREGKRKFLGKSEGGREMERERGARGRRKVFVRRGTISCRVGGVNKGRGNRCGYQGR